MPMERMAQHSGDPARTGGRWRAVFDPALRLRSTSLLAPILPLLDLTGTTRGQSRKRKRKARDEQRLLEALSAILANLSRASLEHPREPSVAVLLAKPVTRRTRYDDGAALGHLRPKLELLERAGLIRLHVSRSYGMASGIEPTDKLAAVLGRITGDDIEQTPRGETVCLRRITKRYLRGGDREVTREFVNYADTPETRTWRGELEAANAFLRDTRIRVLPAQGCPGRTMVRRCVHRLFLAPPEFREGQPFPGEPMHGRLYGGDWISLSSSLRPSLRIGGPATAGEDEPIAYLDYAAMHPRLAYTLIGERPPNGDPYSVEGLSREAAKRFFNAALATVGTFRAGPSFKAMVSEGLIPHDVTPRRVLDAILKAHPKLAPLLLGRSGNTPLCHRLTFLESNVMLRVLGTLNQAYGAPVLPVHDGCMVPVSKADLAVSVMREAAEAEVGYALPITVRLG